MSRTHRANFHQRSPENQAYGTTVSYPVGLSDEVRARSCEALNQVLADTLTLRDMYKKHHWQVSGPTFYSLHLLFDKHFEEQQKLVDTVAERIQTLGGVAIAVPPTWPRSRTSRASRGDGNSRRCRSHASSKPTRSSSTMPAPRPTRRMKMGTT